MHSSPARTPKLQLTAKQPLTGEFWIPPKKDIPHTGAKEKHQIVVGVKSHLESKPIAARDAQRAQTKLCANQKTPQRLSQTCL